MGIYSSGSAEFDSAIVGVYGAASETVTLTSANGKVYTTTTDTTGNGGQLEIPVGVYTISGGYSGYNKSVTVEKHTTAVYAMPNGTIVYWYGFSPYTPVGRASSPPSNSFDLGWITSNKRALTITTNANSITFTQPGANGAYYCGSAVYDGVSTAGGELKLLYSGVLSNVAYFSYADNIPTGNFTPINARNVRSGETELSLGTAAAGTYGIAISSMNNSWTPGQIEVYAIYLN